MTALANRLKYNPNGRDIHAVRDDHFSIVTQMQWRKVAAALAGLMAAAIFTMPMAGQARAPGARPPRAAQTHRGARLDVARFRARVSSALAGSHTAKAHWGVLVADRDTGETLYELNADQFFTPASNAKIFTTTLALATLGPDYRFRTTLESKGTLANNGRLTGDLILAGRGDPDLSNRKFPYAGKEETDGPVDKALAELADAAVAKGLKEVDGDIVADDSFFPYDPYPAGWSVGDLFFRFGAPVSAIDFNDNTISVEMRPGARIGDPATMTVEPEAALNTFGHELTTVADGGNSDFAVVRQPGPNFLLLRGSIALDHAPMEIELAMPDPAETAAADLKQLLESRGVRVTGRIRVQHAAPPETTAAGEPVLSDAQIRAAAVGNPLVLAEHFSPPLLESIRVTNKVSQNLHAELLLRTVGREKLGVGSTAAGLKVERDFLRAARIAEGDVVLSDGSGLASDDLVTPRAVVALLRYALRQPWGAAFVFTLPVAGVDGTLENRMKNTAATGLIEAKTGSGDHSHALSGYATTRSGEYLVFAIFGNNDPQRGNDANATIDEIATAMVETLGTGPRSKRNR
ncbi:MAG TPA: D-alanyl-D-alanine carboxypeptidase/D-alanyl-D-alanine-endopeptidase [Candidatus Acidoferrales bacterium]|nr:D-alanyl-D-alanine carboxypeptidase/D-alanyl-D-alanine-endopeptidase [Candidatus Acidoferrales bacterium]